MNIIFWTFFYIFWVLLLHTFFPIQFWMNDEEWGVMCNWTFPLDWEYLTLPSPSIGSIIFLNDHYQERLLTWRLLIGTLIHKIFWIHSWFIMPNIDSLFRLRFYLNLRPCIAHKISIKTKIKTLPYIIILCFIYQNI